MNGQPVPVPASTAKSCGFATASLVMGILGLICILPVIGSILAIIFGIVALSQIKSSNGSLTGHGKALAGLIIGCVSVVMIPIMGIMLAIMLPAVASAREKARQVQCANNERQLALACLMYAEDYKGTLPQSFDQLGKYGVTTQKLLKCPSAHDGSGSSYQLVLGGQKLDQIKEPLTTAMIVEVPGNHPRGSNVAYADGHVQWVTPSPPLSSY